MSISRAAWGIIGILALIFGLLTTPFVEWVTALAIGIGVILIALALVRINTWIETHL